MTKHNIIRPYIERVDLEKIANEVVEVKQKEEREKPEKKPKSDGQATKRKETTSARKPIIFAPATSVDLSTCILLPSGRYGRHDYPDIHIGMQRLSYNSEVEAVNQRKGWQYENTAKNVNNRHEYDFIGNINHQEAIELNRELGNVTLSLVLGRESLCLLDKGIRSRRHKVYDGNGNIVKKDVLKNIFADITEVREPWRGEWYDTTFKRNGSQWQVSYPIFKTDHWEYVTEELEDCLMEDRMPGIVLEDWLKNATSQGLPLPNAKKGKKMHYWHPRAGYVARFGAYSDGSGFFCDWYPSDRGASLGVFFARAKI